MPLLSHPNFAILTFIPHWKTQSYHHKMKNEYHVVFFWFLFSCIVFLRKEMRRTVARAPVCDDAGDTCI